MPIQLKDPESSLEKAGPITRDQVIKMVDKHRNSRRKDNNSLKFAHFTVLEVLTLLKNNGIIDDPTSILIGDVNNYGVKIYPFYRCPGNYAYFNPKRTGIFETLLL